MAPADPVSLADLASAPLLDRAFEWLCRRRRIYPPDADIWTFRRRWPEEKERLGENRFVLKTDVLARLRDSMKPIQSRAISLRA